MNEIPADKGEPEEQQPQGTYPFITHVKELQSEIARKKFWRWAFVILFLLNAAYIAFGYFGSQILESKQVSEASLRFDMAYRDAGNRFALLSPDEYLTSPIAIPKNGGFGKGHRLEIKECDAKAYLNEQTLVGTNCYLFYYPVRPIPETYRERFSDPLKVPLAKYAVLGVSRAAYEAMLEKGLKLEQLARPCDFLPEPENIRSVLGEPILGQLAYSFSGDIRTARSHLRCWDDKMYQVVLQIYDANRQVEEYVELY